MKRILITGGAGFVGSNLCLMFKTAYPETEVLAFDNLKRRGGELNLPRFKTAGVEFIHGDIRNREDLEALPGFDLLIDCSAEPSVQAGLDGSPLPVIHSNLTGTIHQMEIARQHAARFIFLSTSRVYPIQRLNDLPWIEQETRFTWDHTQARPGLTARGITEDFPLAGARSIYGATKLASELLLQEYVYNYGLKAIINRCGILTGPWQMGKVDQGVITLWLARHHFNKPLKYIGYGGAGKQVRDMLHVADLFDLLLLQLNTETGWDGQIYNVGGGNEVSTSLLELTEKCQAVTGIQIPIAAQPETSSVDLRCYVTDTSQCAAAFDWKPKRDVDAILSDIYQWLKDEEEQLKAILG